MGLYITDIANTMKAIFIILVAAFVEPPLILVGGKLTGCLSNNTIISRWMDRGLGALFVGLGIKLASSDRF